MKERERHEEEKEFKCSAGQHQVQPSTMSQGAQLLSQQQIVTEQQVPNPNVISAPMIKKTSVQQQKSSQTNVANQLAKQNCHEVLGYLPKRGDFEQEYDMDAELLLADMEFFEDDTPENIELKNSVIELYNGRLDERIRRKKFVIERGLLNLK